MHQARWRRNGGAAGAAKGDLELVETSASNTPTQQAAGNNCFNTACLRRHHFSKCGGVSLNVAAAASCRRFASAADSAHSTPKAGTKFKLLRVAPLPWRSRSEDLGTDSDHSDRASHNSQVSSPGRERALLLSAAPVCCCRMLLSCWHVQMVNGDSTKCRRNALEHLEVVCATMIMMFGQSADLGHAGSTGQTRRHQCLQNAFQPCLSSQGPNPALASLAWISASSSNTSGGISSTL
jgi:hypothetical protein